VATWGAYQAETESLLSELADRPRKALYRSLALFQVNLLPAQRLKSARLIEERADGLMVWRGRYDETVGIVDEMPDSFIV
jgi:hypothetical protein